MSDIKVKEAFSLPVKCVYDETGTPFQIEDSYGDLLIDGESTCDETNFEVVAHAINNHDRLTEENAQLKANNAELVAILECLEALTDIWLPSKVSPEFEGEAEALYGFRARYLSLIQKHKESGDGKTN